MIKKLSDLKQKQIEELSRAATETLKEKQRMEDELFHVPDKDGLKPEDVEKLFPPKVQ